MQAQGAVIVEAKDQASIDAETDMQLKAVSQNDLSALSQLLGTLLPDNYSYTSASGPVKFFPENPGTEAFFDVLTPDIRQIFIGDRVRVGPNYDASKGEPGAVYKLIDFTTTLGDTIDLSSENFNNSGRWQKITGGADDINDLFPNFGNLTGSDAEAVGVIVVLNDARSDVDAYLRNVAATADSVEIRAFEDASILATTTNSVLASGGSAFKELGEGDVVGRSGSLVTNLVQSEADAYIVSSSITRARRRCDR